MTDTTLNDIEFVKANLPKHYEVKESSKSGSIHCKSSIGFRKKRKDGVEIEDEPKFDWFFGTMKLHFGKRFQELDHNTCAWHRDFTIYLKQLA